MGLLGLNEQKVDAKIDELRHELGNKVFSTAPSRKFDLRNSFVNGVLGAVAAELASMLQTGKPQTEFQTKLIKTINASLAPKLNRISEQTSAFDTKISEIASLFSSVQKTVNNLSDKVNQLDITTLTALQELSKDFNRDYVSLTTLKDTIEKKNANVEAATDVLQSHISRSVTAKTDFDKLKNQAEEIEKGINKRFNDKETLLTERLNELNKTKTELTNLKKELTNLSENLKKRAEALETADKNLKSQEEDLRTAKEDFIAKQKQQIDDGWALLKAAKDENAERKAELDTKEQTLIQRETYLQKQQAEIDRLNSENQSLSDERNDGLREIRKYEYLATMSEGKNYEDLIDEIDKKNQEIQALKGEIDRRLTQGEHQNKLASAVSSARDEEAAKWNEKFEYFDVIQKKAAECDNFRHQRDSFERQCKAYKTDIMLLENEIAGYQRKLAANERPEEVFGRYQEIERPYTMIPADRLDYLRSFDVIRTPKPLPEYTNEELESIKQELSLEIPWLDNIIKQCAKFGLVFNKRIVYAFHTALKTAEWAPLTILAGVSGTGKSELPRLYSHFGGIFFVPLSVQPNWDSQESMLGFFNAIDNKFDAQPVLNFLAQSQLPATETNQDRLARWQKMSNIELVGTHSQSDSATQANDEESEEASQHESNASMESTPTCGLDQAMCMILLDEMNLAHPELYFAEFLSKLELRRGVGDNDVPSLPVKIGAGLPPYQLRLGRNVLWTGTMNQDETTKSLSDKVLDRSIIIGFPRPKKLIERHNPTPLDEKTQGVPLSRAEWDQWICKEICFNDEDIRKYKDIIEKINEALGTIGRAVGHRVWQSIEYYMANYPGVYSKLIDRRIDKQRKLTEDVDFQTALRHAFEDQLAQKVMPKLRGIDTTGQGDDCLTAIAKAFSNEVSDEFNNDFANARALGYGQFMWQTANYLTTGDNGPSGQNAISVAPKGAAATASTPPIDTATKPQSGK